MKKILFLFIFISLTLNASSLDTLLKEFSQKSDLSQKTKIENGGHLFIYTRNDLNNMQAKTLKDVLKSIPDFTYEESRFLYPDIYNSQALSFQSHTMRLYLDNQELISGNFGSGLPLYGNMSLGFIDHIEIYLGSPSFKFSTEASLLVVKLYTKTTKRDLGGRAKVVIADDKYHQSWINYIDYTNDARYQVFIDFTNDNQDKVDFKSQKLSKDKDNIHFFSKYEKDNLKINLQVSKQKSDAFINLSKDATPLNSNIKNDIYNFNIEKTFLNDKITLSLDHSIIDTILNFNDDNTIVTYSSVNYNSLYKDTRENVTTLKAIYENKISNHTIFSGFDYRRKDIDFKSIKYGNTSINQSFDLQNIYSLYFQDEYWLGDNSILTFGYKFTKEQNNGGIKDENGKTLRVGHIYTNKDFTFKTYYSDTDMLTEPYLITSTYGNPNIKKMSVKLLSHETIYEKGNSKTSLKLGISKLIDSLYYNPFTTKIDNMSNTLGFNYAVLSNEYQVLDFKNFFSMFYSYRDKIPVLGKYDYKGAQLRTTYINGLSTLFSEIIYRQNDESKKDFYDLSLGWKYKVKKDFIFSLKGENILNKAYASKFDVLVNPGGISTQPLYSTHTAQRFLIGIEYLF